MSSRIVVLGGGTGGTLAANRLRRLYRVDEVEITVVDQDDRHVYQPGLLFVPFGLTHSEDIVRPRGRQLRKGISFVESAIDRVDIVTQQVHLDNGACLGYDVLVIATGARLVPDETEGLAGPGWMDNVFTFYTPEGAAALGAALETFDRGRLVVNVVDMPIKCPVAPLEFCFLADWYFTGSGHPRPGRDHLRHAARRRVHEAHRRGASRRHARRRGGSSWSRSSTPARSTAPADAWSATTAARCPSTWPS